MHGTTLMEGPTLGPATGPTSHTQSQHSILRAAFWLVLLAVALGAMFGARLTCPDGQFWSYAQEYVHTGHVQSTFRPVAYPWLIGLVDKPFGEPGVVALQAGMYVILGVFVLSVARSFMGSTSLAYGVALLVMVEPDLASSIPKAWDTLITVVALLGVTAASLRLASGRLGFGPLLCVWLSWGLGMAVRPNLILLALPLSVVLLRWSWSSLVTFAGCCLASFLVCASIVTVAHGSYCKPGNGPYNFFAGANEYTEAALLQTFNAEPSIELKLKADHIQYAGEPRQPWLDPYYKQQAWTFAHHHAGQMVRLGVVKLLTLLRPDTKVHPLGSPAGWLKGMTSLCVPFWAVMLLMSRRLNRQDWIIVAVAVGYTLPFLLTNSDPRFRTPLDALVLTHAAILLLRRLSPPTSLLDLDRTHELRTETDLPRDASSSHEWRAAEGGSSFSVAAEEVADTCSGR